MKSPSQAQGFEWENEAARFLRARGLSVLERGYRCRAGEIDLVCRDGRVLVIVEVRARRSEIHGGAAESIDGRKRRKIIQAARHYLMRHPRCLDDPMRFDVVAFDDIAGARPRATWIRNAFDGG